jgi:hypothetical protein
MLTAKRPRLGAGIAVDVGRVKAEGGVPLSCSNAPKARFPAELDDL